MHDLSLRYKEGNKLVSKVWTSI